MKKIAAILLLSWGAGSGWARPESMKDLNLTEEQKAQMKAIKEASLEQMKRQREELQKEKEKFKGMMQGNATDEEIQKQHEQMQKKREEINDTRFQQRMEMRKVLTPEQRSKFKMGEDEYGERKSGGKKSQ